MHSFPCWHSKIAHIAISRTQERHNDKVKYIFLAGSDSILNVLSNRASNMSSLFDMTFFIVLFSRTNSPNNIFITYGWPSASL